MTEHTNAAPHMACYAIMRQNNKIAFVRREHTGWMNDFYSLPAGRVEWGETAAQGTVREANEEVGVTLKRGSLRHAITVHRHSDDTDWVDIYFEVSAWQGELVNTEPDKHSEAVWLDEANLPDNIIPPQRFALDQIALGNSYAEYGWEDAA